MIRANDQNHLIVFTMESDLILHLLKTFPARALYSLKLENLNSLVEWRPFFSWYPVQFKFTWEVWITWQNNNYHKGLLREFHRSALHRASQQKSLESPLNSVDSRSTGSLACSGCSCECSGMCSPWSLFPFFLIPLLHVYLLH